MNQKTAGEVGRVIGTVIDNTAIQMRGLGAVGIFDKHDSIYRQGMAQMAPVVELIQLDCCKAVCVYCRGEIEDMQAAATLQDDGIVHLPVEGRYNGDYQPLPKPCDGAEIRKLAASGI